MSLLKVGILGELGQFPCDYAPSYLLPTGAVSESHSAFSKIGLVHDKTRVESCREATNGYQNTQNEKRN